MSGFIKATVFVTQIFDVDGEYFLHEDDAKVYASNTNSNILRLDRHIVKISGVDSPGYYILGDRIKL